jgi:hypothetical protein
MIASVAGFTVPSPVRSAIARQVSPLRTVYTSTRFGRIAAASCRVIDRNDRMLEAISRCAFSN